ncbi:MAG: hypothetical protein QOE70_2154 [Chthoniobacter sp.]|jgi:ectoine hydroxylase-related dioxygenase (phytanoyl-CoA dioxygenase family)|nr:hypothetical protein [Chthoniobacter sp.]
MPASITLTSEQIDRFHRDGFLAIDRITEVEEVARLRAGFDRLFATRAGRERGKQFDLAGTDEEDRPAVLPQILDPVEFAPEFAQTQFRANALAIAQQLLGPEAERWFEHAILKPAGYGAATPWHQDEAHRNDPGVEYEQLSIWMPLQEANAANGCMQFIPRSHRGPVLEHHSPNNDPRVTALECIGAFDPAEAVLCPLPAGGATVHHCRTLHHAGPNVSATPRRAYIIAFRGKMRPAPAFAGYAWNTAKQTPAQARAEAWRKRGGAVAQGWRWAAGSTRRVIGKLRRAGGKVLRMMRSGRGRAKPGGG